MGRRRRSNGKIDKLPDGLRETVEQMLLAKQPYREIVEYLREQGVALSQMAVCTYAKKYLASVEQLRLSQENMRVMMEELEKYPDLDVTEAILRVATSSVFNAMTAMADEEWDGLPADKLLKQATALTRAAAYKKRIDLQNRTARETALETNKALLSDVLARKHPDLYRQVMDAIKQEQPLLDKEEP